MATVHLVNDPRQAAMLAAPLRRRFLEALAEPGSASTMARSLGLTRQKVAYHVRQLEKHGFVELVREESAAAARSASCAGRPSTWSPRLACLRRAWTRGSSRTSSPAAT